MGSQGSILLGVWHLKKARLFRDLVSKVDITQWSIWTCFEAFKIITQCWKARDICLVSCDWTTIMSQLRYSILLR